MIKGCTKRVVVVKDVESDIFEEAYFIMRPKSEKAKGHLGKTDILTEANRIVFDKTPDKSISPVVVRKKRKSFVRDLLFFCMGAAVGISSFAMICL